MKINLFPFQNQRYINSIQPIESKTVVPNCFLIQRSQEKRQKQNKVKPSSPSPPREISSPTQPDGKKTLNTYPYPITTAPSSNASLTVRYVLPCFPCLSTANHSSKFRLMKGRSERIGSRMSETKEVTTVVKAAARLREGGVSGLFLVFFSFFGRWGRLVKGRRGRVFEGKYYLIGIKESGGNGRIESYISVYLEPPASGVTVR